MPRAAEKRFIADDRAAIRRRAATKKLTNGITGIMTSLRDEQIGAFTTQCSAAPQHTRSAVAQ